MFQMGWFNHQLVIVEKTQKPPGFDGSEDKISMTELHDKVLTCIEELPQHRWQGITSGGLVGRLVIS